MSNKAVMLSVRPEWCQKIISGKKTMELRKSFPLADNVKTPFKCYIYCTQGTGKNTLNIPVQIERIRDEYIETGSMKSLNCPIGNGKVIGEFVCDAILSHCEMANADLAEQLCCVRREKIMEYSGGKEVFGWHISELVIYDKPKELSEFFKPCIKEAYPWCLDCERGLTAEERLAHIHERSVDVPCGGWLKSPPQSWCYVEEL